MRRDSGNRLHCIATGFGALTILTTAILAILAGPGYAADRHKPGPAIPFETDRAKLRGDRSLLKLNDDASVIPGKRIEALPVVDGKIGDRAKLDGGLLIYFPYGRIVTAETEFSPYRRSAAGTGQYEPDPAYRRVENFDKVLGPVCARVADSASRGGEVDMRIGVQNVISLVQAKPVSDGPGAALGQKHYRVVTALDIRNLQSEPHAAALYASCVSGKPASQVARD